METLVQSSPTPRTGRSSTAPRRPARRRRGAGPILLLAFAVLSSAVASAQRDRGGSERTYDPRASYTYSLDERDGHTIEVTVDADGFTWPDLPDGAETVFVALDVEAKRRGRRGEPPVIHARAGASSLHQFLEPKARGRRYLNLSALARSGLETGRRVELEGIGVRIATGTAALTAFVNQPLDERRVLVLAPHPDDAEIAAFGVYTAARADVVTVTAGDAGGWNFRSLWDEAAEHYRIKGLVRTWDSVTIPLLGGLEPGAARNLAYYDATLHRLWELRPRPLEPRLAELERPGAYRRMNLDPELRRRPLEPTWPALVADLQGELERVRPEVVVAPHPFLDAHRDHQFTTVALIEAIDALRRRREPLAERIELYLYTNHPVSEESFPFGPASGVLSLPPWQGDGLLFARLHSHPLDAETVRLKVLALEAMHDLRPFSATETMAVGELYASAREESRRQKRRRRRDAAIYSYYRRAARPNELFFVLGASEASELRRRFLAERYSPLQVEQP